ncbi:hypothetical protein [Shinella zoogloeoides]|uniref:hypothetical protein n=1 Tax=Shinella zoogloeoides TaxID=352475 RepID=UPI00299F3ED5|nr:hypothetical protein [Shinella zoogloeoides]WPE19923.1 hypothetical protein ShzoTeo12_10990 [Shinella zoogloeoides]
MGMLDRNHYRTLTTSNLEGKLSRANERVKRASCLTAALDDLFTIDEIEAVLSERKNAAASLALASAA